MNMCGIAGFVHQSIPLNQPEYKALGEKMAHTLSHRGPDAEGVVAYNNAVLAHARLAVIDLEGGNQPMTRTRNGKTYTVVYNGELYNTKEIRRELIREGASLSTESDTEVLLLAYMYFGPGFVHLLNGIYAFAIWDESERKLFLCRDRFGVKPLFYTMKDGFFVFGSEIKALFAFGVPAELDREGLCEIFGIGPAVSPGVGVFKNIHEVKPGYSGYLTEEALCLTPYYRLHSALHTDSYEETVDTVRYLLCDAVRRQTVSDVPLCTFLSGGLDSSLITAIVAKNQQAPLCTYSFDYEGNDRYFKPSEFQPDADGAYINIMAETFKTDHKVLYQNSVQLVENLYKAVEYKDLPGMADVDSSLLGFLRQVRQRHTVALSGECADEIFGGYPWFFKEEMLNCGTFPWCPDVAGREAVLAPALRGKIGLLEYVQEKYESFLSEMPEFTYRNPLDTRRREVGFLNLYWFMATLLNRKDRMSMASGLEVRVPFCDHRLIQYVWNIPWDMKAKDGERKHILREAAKGILPESVRCRKKSPYPKTHNPDFEKLVKQELKAVLQDRNAPIRDLIDLEYANKLTEDNYDYGKPWFGQLMAGPQRIAYLLQVNYWLEKYNVRILSA